MANSLSEGFLRLTSTGASGVHHQILPINYEGTPTAGAEPTLTKKDASTIGAEAGFDEFLDQYEKIHPASVNYGLVEAYTVNPTTGERTFIYGWNAARVGASGAAPVPLSMATMTFKTIGGGVLKIVAMDGVIAVNQKFFPPYGTGTTLDSISDYIVSGDSIAIGRDNDYAFAPISATIKTSDALRKRAGL